MFREKVWVCVLTTTDKGSSCASLLWLPGWTHLLSGADGSPHNTPVGFPPAVQRNRENQSEQRDVWGSEWPEHTDIRGQSVTEHKAPHKQVFKRSGSVSLEAQHVLKELRGESLQKPENTEEFTYLHSWVYTALKRAWNVVLYSHTQTHSILPL